MLENPRATVVVIHPDTGAQYRLAVRYLRTEESGPLFECMKAKLAGIASHAGMTGVFRLRGADVYRVESIERGVRHVDRAPAARPSTSSRPLRAADGAAGGAPRPRRAARQRCSTCCATRSASRTPWC